MHLRIFKQLDLNLYSFSCRFYIHLKKQKLYELKIYDYSEDRICLVQRPYDLGLL